MTSQRKEGVIANLLPSLDSATEAALRESIRRFGVLVPVLKDQDGELVDGYHRMRLAGEEGRACPEQTVHLPDDPDERAAALVGINDARRPKLSTETRKQVVVALREQGHSERAIAGALGVSKTQVHKDIDEVVTGDHLPQPLPGEVTGQDGKQYPASKPKKSQATKKDGRRKKHSPHEVATNLIHTLQNIASTVEALDVDEARATASPDEVKQWIKDIEKVQKTLRCYRTALSKEST